MDLSKILITSLILSSCVPVNYDSVVWNRQEIKPEARSGVKIVPALRNQGSNSFNSQNKGPWRVVLSIRMNDNRKIKLNSIVIRYRNEGSRKMEINYAIPITFYGDREWRGSYVSDEDIALVPSNNPISLEFDVTVEGVGRYVVKSRFVSNHLKGGEVINILTM
jgi:hypothetical protein